MNATGPIAIACASLSPQLQLPSPCFLDDVLTLIFGVLSQQNIDLTAASQVNRQWKRIANHCCAKLIKEQWPHVHANYPTVANWVGLVAQQVVIDSHTQQGNYSFSHLLTDETTSKALSVLPLGGKLVAVERNSVRFPKQLDVVDTATGATISIFELSPVHTLESHVLIRAFDNTIRRTYVLTGEELDPITGFEGTVQHMRADGLKRLYFTTTTPASRFYVYDLNSKHLCELTFDDANLIPRFSTLTFNDQSVWMILEDPKTNTDYLYEWSLPQDSAQQVQAGIHFKIIPDIDDDRITKLTVHENIFIINDSTVNFYSNDEKMRPCLQLQTGFALAPGKIFKLSPLATIECFEIAQKSITRSWDLEDTFEAAGFQSIDIRDIKPLSSTTFLLMANGIRQTVFAIWDCETGNISRIKRFQDPSLNRIESFNHEQFVISDFITLDTENPYRLLDFSGTTDEEERLPKEVKVQEAVAPILHTLVRSN